MKKKLKRDKRYTIMINGFLWFIKRMESKMKKTKVKQKQKKKNPILTGLGIFAILTVFVLVFICAERTNYYKTHFLPNTYINGMNSSDLDAQTVGGMLEQKVKEYELAILGQDELGSPKEIGRISAEQIALELEDGTAAANELLSQQEPTKWFRAVLGKEEQHIDAVHAVIFDEGLLETLVMQFDAFIEENMSAPVDAYISEYQEEVGGFTIVSEILGTQLHKEEALSSIKTVIMSGAPLIDLAEQGCYEQPKVFSDDKKLSEDLAEINKWLGAKITYDWNTVEVIVDAEVIKDWIVTGEEEIRIDEESVADFVGWAFEENNVVSVEEGVGVFFKRRDLFLHQLPHIQMIAEIDEERSFPFVHIL